MGKVTISGEVAREYLHKWPNTSTHTLARMMYEENSEIWSSVEAARSALRRYRGANGRHSRANIRARTAYTQTAEARAARLPDSDAEEYKPYYLPNGYGLVLADAHIPYHSTQAIEIAIAHAAEKGATDWVLLLGDIMDCYSLSRWTKDPRARDFAGEREATWQFMDYLKTALKSPKLIYKLGNHEDRLERYMATKAPELYGCEEVRFEKMLQFDSRGIDCVKATQVIYCGYLTILHGHEYGGSFFSPVNPARGVFLRAKDCALCAHQHQTSHHTDPTIRDKQISCWSVGALCDLHPRYRPLNRWNHGFALLKKNGQNFDIENKRILPDGELV